MHTERAVQGGVVQKHTQDCSVGNCTLLTSLGWITAVEFTNKSISQ